MEESIEMLKRRIAVMEEKLTRIEFLQHPVTNELLQLQFGIDYNAWMFEPDHYTEVSTRKDRLMKMNHNLYVYLDRGGMPWKTI